jgi:hypothetical protein
MHYLARTLNYIYIIIMTTSQLDLLKRFNPSDSPDVSENVMEMKTDKDVEMKMKEICLERSSAPFEPKVVVNAVLQDVTNTRKKRRQGGSSVVPDKERPQWYSLLDRRLLMGRLILEDVIKNDRMSQIILLLPPTALLYRDNKVLDPLFKICDEVGYSYSVLRRGQDYYQVPCTIFGIGFDDPANTDSVLIQLKNAEWCETKRVSFYFAGKQSRGGLLNICERYLEE